MKKKYEAPQLEVEMYALDSSIASNCYTVVSAGPADANHTQCSDYEDPFAGEFQTIALYNIQFYEDNKTCDCYYSSGEGYFMS